MVREDPTNNVPDSIFTKLGMQLHRRPTHPLGILKNAIFDYFDTNYPNKFDKFDDLCPIVSAKEVTGYYLLSCLLISYNFHCWRDLVTIISESSRVSKKSLENDEVKVTKV